jgi:catechol 2,3-dioxygenase-like lactoylglutathione lyase family enzyme
MADTLDRLLDQYDQGFLSRRQLLKGLALATGGVLAGGAGLAEAAEAQSSTPLVRGMEINHVHLYVKDIARTVDFYSGVLGAKLVLDQPNSKRMTLPGSTPGSGAWISISPGKADSPDPASRPGAINHAAYGVAVSTSEINRITEEIKKRFPDVAQPRVSEADSAGYFYDPSGIAVQLIQMDNNGENIVQTPKKG